MKSGGILVYSTCTLSLDENERVVNAFLEKDTEFEPYIPDGEKSFVRTFFPGEKVGDGFFMAMMRRKGCNVSR